MRELLLIFQEVEDPRRGNAKRHDLHEMLLIALLATLTGGRTCAEMEDYGCAAERWLRTFLTLKNGIPSHDTFSRLFRLLDPASLQKALLRLAQDWADRLGDVVAVDGRPKGEAGASTECAMVVFTGRLLKWSLVVIIYPSARSEFAEQLERARKGRTDP